MICILMGLTRKVQGPLFKFPTIGKRFRLTLAYCALLCAGKIQAQPFTSTFTSTAAGGNWSNGSTWVGGVSPGSSCSNCEIIIASGSSVTLDIPVDLSNNSLMVIDANASATITSPLELDNNSELLVGSDGSSPASLVVDEELDLTTSSFIRLANINTFINASAVSTGTGIVGLGAGGSGIYYITGPPGYNTVLTASGYQNPFPPPATLTTYGVNCGGASPNTCTTGFVFGPAISASVNGVNTFVAFSPLPVELVSFSATLDPRNQVNVIWATAEEVNSNYYSVERSADAASFQEIGQEKARGFSSVTTNYSYSDQSPLPGTGYYRLKMVDLDGKFKYSRVVTVFRNGKGPSLLVLSNPFRDQVRLEVNSPAAGELLLSLTDLQGRVVMRAEQSIQPGGNLVNLVPGTTLSQGMYLLQVKGSTINQTIKLVKLP